MTRIVAALLAAIVAVIALVDLSRTEYVHPGRELLDFRVAYCAGQAVLAHRDPYRVEPIRSCEHANPAPMLRAEPNLVMPWVLPGYVTALAVPLAALPFGVALVCFIALLVAAIGAGIVAVMRTTGASLGIVAPALVGAAFPSYALGQVGPFELLAVAGTALALRSRRFALGGVAAAATCLEPHVGIFVCLAIAVAVPAARIGLAVGIAALALLAIVTTGPAAQFAYLTADLPLQGVGQAGSHEQYSLTYALMYAGLPEHAALLAGTVSTCAMLVVSTLLALTLARTRDIAYAAYLPAGLALAGGVYLHLAQIALAIPALLLILRDARTVGMRMTASIAIVLLAIPWPYPATFKQLLPATLLLVGILVWHLSGSSLRAALAAVAVCWLALFPIENHTVAYPHNVAIARAPADAFATISAGEAVGQTFVRDPALLVVKLATWAGLLGLLGASTALAFGPRRVEPLDRRSRGTPLN